VYIGGVNRKLDPKQEEAAFAPHVPLLITAGAGSGKTRTLTNRLAYFIEQGIPANKIIAITFTNKAAGEMKNRLSSYYLKGSACPFIGTFHSLGSRILREEAEKLGRRPNFAIFDNDDSEKVIKAILKNADFKEKLFLPAVRDRVSKIKNEFLPREEEDEKIRLIFESYEKSLNRQNAFDFDDLIEKPVRLFLSLPEILEKYRNRFAYILVDEYQDINSSQYLFIKLLAEKHRRLSVVGDDQQSIYSFRGSDFRNFLNFENDWPDAKVVVLDQNYRSSGNIISAAGAVISQNTLQRPKNLWTKNEPGEPVKIRGFNHPEEEADYLADIIAGLAHPEETAILYRTNAQSRQIEQSLISSDIGYEIFGGLKFYERYEIKDLVAGLRFANNPKDEVSRNRLETNFRRAVSKELIGQLPLIAKSASPLEIIGFFLKTADYENLLSSKFPNAEERKENLGELINFAGGFPTLAEFLERISLFQSGDSLKKNIYSTERVKLMTIHLAKGLEFENVFLVGATEGILPHQKSLLKKYDLEEERRLMYVGMTRAKKRLCISFYGPASRFLYEIPPEIVEFRGEANLKREDEIYLD
jgi:DNA helicase-2/ATP-dependent DNA helicase PcrA